MTTMIAEELPPHDPGRFFVARIAGQRVGHLFVSNTLIGRLDADVSPQYHRRGIATALYLAALSALGELRARDWEQSLDAYALWASIQRRGLADVSKCGRCFVMRPVSPRQSGGPNGGVRKGDGRLSVCHSLETKQERDALLDR
jgi:GNAT superfamily N-acetyltransferase